MRLVGNYKRCRKVPLTHRCYITSLIFVVFLSIVLFSSSCGPKRSPYAHKAQPLSPGRILTDEEFTAAVTGREYTPDMEVLVRQTPPQNNTTRSVTTNPSDSLTTVKSRSTSSSAPQSWSVSEPWSPSPMPSRSPRRPAPLSEPVRFRVRLLKRKSGSTSPVGLYPAEVSLYYRTPSNRGHRSRSITEPHTKSTDNAGYVTFKADCYYPRDIIEFIVVINNYEEYSIPASEAIFTLTSSPPYVDMKLRVD